MSAGISTSGINWIALGLIDDTGKLIADAKKGLSESGVVLLDGDGEGATTANITNIEEAGTQQYANNKVKRTAHGVPTPQVAVTYLDLPYEIAMKCNGYELDTTGGATLGDKPHVAMLICSDDFKGNKYFDGFANGEMIMPNRNHGTNNKNETDANATFTYQALTPIDDTVFVNSNGTQQPYKQWNSGATGFNAATMLKEVFGGYAGDDITKHGQVTKPGSASLPA